MNSYFRKIYIWKKFNQISKKNKMRKLEIIFAFLASITFIIHISSILLAKAEIINNELLKSSSLIVSITTPFTIILIYEIIELAISFKKPLINSVIQQFEIISLIYVRNIFKTFAELETLKDGVLEDLIREIILILTIGIILFITVKIMTKLIKTNKKLISKEPVQISKFKILTSIIVLSGSLIIIFNYFAKSSFSDFITYSNDRFKLTNVFGSIFTLMILADIINFLLTFFYNDKYSQLFRNAVYILATIIIRLSIAVPQPYDILLVLISIVITITITIIQIKLPQEC